MTKHLAKITSIVTVCSIILTFTANLQAQESYTPPPSGSTYTPPPSGTTYTPPPNSTYTPPPTGTYTPPPTGTTTDPSAGCSSSGGKWCPSTTGTGGGWCSYSTSPCPTNSTSTTPPPTNNTFTTPPPSDNVQTTCAAGGKWCTSSSGTGGWCSYGSTPCPAHDATSCAAQSGKWCTNSGGSGGWCSTDPYTMCPANDESSCKTQSGVWCKYAGTTSTNAPTGWCSTGPNASCPANSEADCKAQNRLWCIPQASSASGSVDMGWCAGIGEKCPAYTEVACKAQGSQWCVNQGTNSGGWCTAKADGCPINDQATCNAKGKTWCKPTSTNNNYGGTMSGWCLMGTGSWGGTSTCGYGYEAVAPTTPTPKPSIPEPIMICADGTTPPAGGSCSDNTVTACAKKGGIWCADTTGKSQSYCSMSGSCTTTPTPKPPVETTEKNIEKLSDRDVKAAERERSSILRSLGQLVPVFKKYGDNEATTKVQALIDKVKGLPVDPAIFQNLQTMRDEVDALKEYRDELSNKGVGEDAPADSERDQALKSRALKSFQRDIRGFDKNYTTIQARIKTIEKAGFTVSEDLKEALSKSTDIVKQIGTTTNYDEAQDAMETLRDSSALINDEVTNLEQIGQLVSITTSVNRKITQVDSAVKTLGSTAKRLGGDVAASVTSLGNKVSEVRAAMAQIKTGDFGEQEPFEYFQSEVADKLEDIFSEVENIKAVANLRQALAKFNGKITRYNSRLNTLKRKGTDVAEAATLLDEAKSRVDDLKKLAVKSVTPEIAAEAKEIMDSLVTVSESLDEALGIKTSSLFGDELQKASKSTLPRLQISQLDRATLNGIRVATLFQRNPNSVLVYLPNQSLAANKLRRTKFVLD